MLGIDFRRFRVLSSVLADNFLPHHRPHEFSPLKNSFTSNRKREIQRNVKNSNICGSLLSVW